VPVPAAVEHRARGRDEQEPPPATDGEEQRQRQNGITAMIRGAATSRKPLGRLATCPVPNGGHRAAATGAAHCRAAKAARADR
jgi:hypothetical protein